jgi:hypothetical protein
MILAEERLLFIPGHVELSASSLGLGWVSNAKISFRDRDSHLERIAEISTMLVENAKLGSPSYGFTGGLLSTSRFFRARASSSTSEGLLFVPKNLEKIQDMFGLVR